MAAPKRPSPAGFVSAMDSLVPDPSASTASVTSIERPRDKDVVDDKPSTAAKPKRAKRESHRTFPGALAKAPEVEPTTKITVSLPSQLVNELRNAVIYHQGQGRRVSLRSLIVDAVEPLLKQLRDDIGGTIPQRPAEYEQLMTGRPPGGDTED